MNRQSVIIVVGLPGSGKSHYLRTQVSKTHIKFDDPTSTLGIFTALSEGKSVAVASPQLCDSRHFQRFMDQLKDTGLNLNIHVKYFENLPAVCFANIIWRNEKHMDIREVTYSDISVFADMYKIPDGAITLPVWKGALKKSTIGSQE